jgi:hypothetical protein
MSAIAARQADLASRVGAAGVASPRLAAHAEEPSSSVVRLKVSRTHAGQLPGLG